MTSTSKIKYRLPSPEEKPQYVKENFNAIAKNYNLFNDLITFGLHRLWKNRVVKETGLSSLKEWAALDLCCGSGDIALRLKNVKGEGHVYALDFSDEMLQILKDRTDDSQGQPMELIEGDATDLQRFRHNSMDAVTIGFGLRNIVKRERTLKESLRVLKSGSPMVILDVGRTIPFWAKPFHAIFFRKIVPWIGFLIHGGAHDMYRYLPASAEIYPDQKSLKKELEGAGFVRVKYKNFMLGSAVIHTAWKDGERKL